MDIPTPDGVCDAFVAYPQDGGPYPGVVFYMDAIGLRPVLYDMARQLAAEGYYVLLPNVFYRQGRAPLIDLDTALRPENLGELRSTIMPFMTALTPDTVERDAAVYLDHLAGQPQVRSGPVGLTGYCMGGALVVRTAAAQPERVAVAASFHAGNLATEAADSPHRQADRVRAELYIGHADQDDSMPAEQIQRLEQALDAAGNQYHSELYSGAGHGFTMVDLPVYDQAAADRHWDRLRELFSRNLQPTQ
ncbi:MAG: dienelactone hydrolase family protein [Pseudonocardiaceae bacterium]|nr:dienelactone hydrolase family protein [Pseudonocardiaceae bacterium]